MRRRLDETNTFGVGVQLGGVIDALATVAVAPCLYLSEGSGQAAPRQ